MLDNKFSGTLLIVQPILASYRKSMFDSMVSFFDDVDVYASLSCGDGFSANIEGEFNLFHTPILGIKNKVYFQRGIIFSVLKKKPAAIFMTADFRAINFWVLLVIAKLLKIPVFSHGQGLYNKSPPGFMQHIMFNITASLSSQYICYTRSVYLSLVAINISTLKLSIMDNMVVNKFLVRPDEKKEITHKVFYIGRLREGCNLELLFNAMISLKKKGKKIALDVIGEGSEKSRLESLSSQLGLDISFLGAIYDDNEISLLSRKCTLGVYPGDAGLSLVHYMSLSLVPIVHNDLTKHMGPEPSYIKSGVNGLMFKRGDAESLAYVIEKALCNEHLVRKLSKSAFNTYCSLSNPSMASKLLLIMKPFLNTKG